MIKTFHLHSSLTFISDTECFEGKDFENYLIILDNSNTSGELFSSGNKNIYVFNYSLKSIQKITHLCRDADLVVLYDLDFIKCKIALKLPSRTKIAWRFFGHEIYGRELQSYTSELSKEISIPGINERIGNILSSKINLAKSFIKWGYKAESIFFEAIERINFFLCYSTEEYDFLSQHHFSLPFFIKFPLRLPPLRDTEVLLKENLIIIGNNKSIYNNNLDVIKIIEKSGNKGHLKFVLLFNYGSDSLYSKGVLHAVEGKKYFIVLSNFLPLLEFEELYKKTSAVVFNGYRQMALGNIFLALKYGVKMYLNEKNLVKQWLSNEGFKVHSVNDLLTDLNNLDFRLSSSDSTHNYINLQRLIKSYTPFDFQNKISSNIS